jgi:hypothetical protein
MIACRSCVRVIDLGNGIRWMISGFAAFASESSKADRLRFAVSRAADINCIVPHLDALQNRSNGFIRERRLFQG